MCTKSISSYVCTYCVLFCVLHCPFRYGDQTYSHTPRLLFLGNVKAMYTSPLKRIRPRSFHLLLPPLSFSLTLSVVLLYHTTFLTVRLLFLSFSAWCLQVPLRHDDGSESPSEVCLAVGSKVCWCRFFLFFFITALFFCSPTTLLFVTCLAGMQTGRYQL